MKNADTLFSKGNINFQLEEIMDSKNYSDEAKSLILNVVYKIENSYKDYSKLKYNVKTKDDIISDITNILKNDCDTIDIVDPKENNDELLVDKENKKIKVFPSEISMLNAIYSLSNQGYKKTKSILNRVLVDALNIGHSTNGTEIIRDFNGWSWTGSIENNKTKLYNLLYQDLIILLGLKNLEEVFFSENARQSLIKKLIDLYGEKKAYDLVKKIDVCCMLLYADGDEKKIEEVKNHHKILREKYKIIDNKPQYISIINKKNEKKMKVVNFIEKALKNKGILEKKYLRPGIKEKYGYLENYRAHLIRIQKKKLQEINKNTSLISPFEYIKKKEELGRNLDSFDEYERTSCQEEAFYDSFLVLQRSTIACFYKKIDISELRKELLGIVYEIRYLNYVQFQDEMLVKDIKELEVDIRNVQKKLVSKLYEIKAVDAFSNDENTNYQIIKNIFLSKNLNMNKLYVKLKYNDKKLYIEYYDEDTLDGQNSIRFSDDDFKELVKKTNKKIKIFI